LIDAMILGSARSAADMLNLLNRAHFFQISIRELV
jgi:hypothetical protein